jgi:arylsulfatase
VRSRRIVVLLVVLSGFAAAAFLWSHRLRAPRWFGTGGEKRIVYDLADLVPVAERWSSREVLLFGTPAAEPHQAEGFYREAAQGAGDSFLWTKGEAEVSLQLPDARPRGILLDLAPYEGVRGQTVQVRLNGTEVARLNLNDARFRYAISLPPTAQVVGENRMRFVFGATASPSDQPGNADRRQLAAKFHSLVIADAGDPNLQDLLGRDAPRPYAAMSVDKVPGFSQVGESTVRYAIRLPQSAELRFTPELDASARSAQASASFRVTLEAEGAAERELWSGVTGPRDTVNEVAVTLPGREGDIVRLGLHVGGPTPGARFAWGTWRAPRVLGVGHVDSLEGAPLGPEDQARANDLRARLSGLNVMLVVLDAARAKEFGVYGQSRPTTPEIDRIASDGVVFEHVYTPAVYTLGAMSSVWTSQYPDRHHGDVSFSAGLPKDRLTLAELLGGRGIPSVGFVANTVAGGLNGFDRGFSEFHEVWKEIGSRGDVFRQAVPPWLKAHGSQRFFAYVHFREPHFPYDPEPPFDTRFGPDGPIPKDLRRDATFLTDVNQGRRTLTAEEKDHLTRLYAGNLAYADQEVGALRRSLEDLGLWEKTVLIVTADHGEGMLEHGWVGHNVQLFEESVHVPLIIRFPQDRGPRGVRVKGLADLLGLAPTIADIFGLKDAEQVRTQFQGRTLLPQIGGAPGRTAVLSRTVWDRPIYGLRDDRFKFVYDTRTGAQTLYDLAQDPGETRDAREAQPLRAAYYAQTLHHWTARVARSASPSASPPPMTREECENLKALGYLGSGTDCSKYQ